MKHPKRPHIPLEVRCRVAARQIGYGNDQISQIIGVWRTRSVLSRGMSRLLIVLLARLRIILGVDAGAEMQLDHRPPLGLRKRSKRTGRYTPDANDPNFLEWVPKVQHLDRTAGVGGERMRFGGDTRAVAKTRRLEAEPKKWQNLSGPKKRRPVTKRSRAKIKTFPARGGSEKWPAGRKLRSRGFTKKG